MELSCLSVGRSKATQSIFRWQSQVVSEFKRQKGCSRVKVLSVSLASSKADPTPDPCLIVQVALRRERALFLVDGQTLGQESDC